LQWDSSGKGYNSQQDRAYPVGGVMGCIPASHADNKVNILLPGFYIRRLTPREVMRLFGFPDSYKIIVSDTQAYKQGGNSIVVHVLGAFIKNLNRIGYASKT